MRRLLAWLGCVSAEVHRLELAHRDQIINRLEVEAAYWQTRAERLIDANLARAGAIHEPTMREGHIPPPNPAALFASALSITEIDSTRKGAA